MSSSSAANEEYVLAERPVGIPTENTFRKQAAPTPDASELKDGQVVAKLLYASVDPYMRGGIRVATIGSVHSGYAVAEVVATKSAKFAVGDLFYDMLPWRRYTIHTIDTSPSNRKVDAQFLRDNNLSPSTYLSALGMVALTAYFGLREVLQLNPANAAPSTGLTVVVSGAAGATGGLAVQLARLLGATRVIGIAGGKDKCEHVIKDLGADGCVDYKEHTTVASIRDALKALAPNGVDRYFDNTGGHATDAVFDLTNKYARVAVCGQISQYNTMDQSDVTVPAFMHKLIYKSVTVQGFVVTDYAPKFHEFIKDALPWIAQKKLKDKQHLVHGFEQIPKAFVGLFTGANVGKTIIEVAHRTA